MKFYLFVFCLIPIILLTGFQGNENQDYSDYHKQVIDAERLISGEKFVEALFIYEQIFNRYNFIFLRDYKVASQLALFLGNKNVAFKYIKEGIISGWELKELKKDKFLAPLQVNSEWKTIEIEYNDYRSAYLAKIDQPLREKVQKMFNKDQLKTMGALIKIGDKAKVRYATKKFAPHSEAQITKLFGILENDAYPGEKLIGNDYWVSTIIGHHNSISKEYSQKDTLFNAIKPMLLQAIENGQMSPYEYALLDDWHIAVLTDRTEPGYGFLNSPLETTLSETNDLRLNIGLRTIELRNKLVEIEEKTGMNLFLPNWIEGKIKVEQK